MPVLDIWAAPLVVTRLVHYLHCPLSTLGLPT